MEKNRRAFLKKSSLAALSVPFFTNARVLSNVIRVSNKPLNLGIIGCGGRGSGIASLLKDSSLYKIVACCDILDFRLNSLSQSTGAKPFLNYKDLLGDSEVEAVLIASPFGLHDEMAIDAIKAGKHIFCEKTMAKGIDEIQLVLDAYKDSEIVFQTGHQYTSSELYQKVFDVIRSGYIGEITAFDCQWNRNGNWRQPVPDPKLERAINWRMYREHSGGLVAELCSHQIDFICRVLDELPKKIVGFGGIDHWKDGRETFDNVHLLFEYPNGINASFMCTTTNAFDDYKIKILGSKATIILDYVNAKIYLEKKAVEKEIGIGIVVGVSGATKMPWDQGEGAAIEESVKSVTKTDL